MTNKFVGLIILDGFGLNKKKKGNAIKLAHPTFLEKTFKQYPYTTLQASGEYVGLPKGQIGNSEVGHLNIGAGKVVYQSLLKINHAIEDGSIYQNETILALCHRCKSEHKSLHLMGLLSDGGVHSHIEHLFALIDICKNEQLEDVVIHAFLDGRDTYRDSALTYLESLEQKIKGTSYKIGTIIGRYYAMDREQNYDITKVAWEALTKGIGETTTTYKEKINEYYKQGVFDEFMPPIIVNNSFIKKNDGVLFYNYREDRARQLTRVFTDKAFTKFETKGILVDMVTFTSYDDTLTNLSIVFPKEIITHNLSSILSRHGLKQFKITETTKYAHVTYFLNGGIETPYEGEDRFLIDTIKVKQFDEVPGMRAKEITEQAIDRILSKKYQFMALNYSNCDMIGHTGNLHAAIDAVQIIDKEVEKLVNAIRSIGGVAIITADHGNAECMIDSKGRVLTDHTTNVVPFCIVTDEKLKLNKGSLSNIAPTILELLDVNESLQQSSLIKHR